MGPSQPRRPGPLHFGCTGRRAGPAVTLPACLRAEPVGRRMLSFEVVQAQRRGRVLAAVTDVFATRGYRATTIDDLIAASQIGVGSFYALFEGKEACFLRAYDRVIDAASERIAAALPAVDVSWPERTRVALEALLGWIAAEPLAARIVLIEAQAAGPAPLARYQATLERLASLLRARTRAQLGGRQAAGELRVRDSHRPRLALAGAACEGRVERGRGLAAGHG